jgi:hypothetical protein
MLGAKMPYIKQDLRDKVSVDLKNFTNSLKSIINDENRSGILNYAFSKIALEIIDKQPKYSKINDIIGALECAKLELYRRTAAPYEDRKIGENGDI